MSALKSLSFTTVSKTSGNPLLLRRSKLVQRLEEQKKLVEDSNYVRSIKRWTKVDGEKRLIEKQTVVRPWWKSDGSGNLVLSMTYGTKAIEFEKGKTGIVVSSLEKLIPTIDVLIKATQQGELDGILTQINSPRTGNKIRRAS